MARQHVFPVCEPSFLDRKTLGLHDAGTSIVFLRRFSEQIVGSIDDDRLGGTFFNHFIVTFNREDSDDSFVKEQGSNIDGLRAKEIEIPPGFIVCIGSKDPNTQSESQNAVTLPGHPSDAFSIPGTEYSTNNRLNRLYIGDGEWVTIMWTGTRWVWMGSNNWY